MANCTRVRCVTIAGVDLEVLHTPGHSPGAVCFSVPALGVRVQRRHPVRRRAGRHRTVVLGLPDDHRLDLAPAAEPAARDGRAHRSRRRHHHRRRGSRTWTSGSFAGTEPRARRICRSPTAALRAVATAQPTAVDAPVASAPEPTPRRRLLQPTRPRRAASTTTPSFGATHADDVRRQQSAHDAPSRRLDLTTGSTRRGPTRRVRSAPRSAAIERPTGANAAGRAPVLPEPADMRTGPSPVRPGISRRAPSSAARVTILRLDRPASRIRGSP